MEKGVFFKNDNVILDSKEAYCKYLCIKEEELQNYLLDSLSLYDIYSLKVNCCYFRRDYLAFKSASEFCSYLNISRAYLYKLQNKGLTIDNIFDKYSDIDSVSFFKRYDLVFKTAQNLCDFLGISRTYFYKLKVNFKDDVIFDKFSLKKGEVPFKSSTMSFKSFNSYCDFLNITESAVFMCFERNLSLKDIYNIYTGEMKVYFKTVNFVALEREQYLKELGINDFVLNIYNKNKFSLEEIYNSIHLEKTEEKVSGVYFKNDYIFCEKSRDFEELVNISRTSKNELIRGGMPLRDILKIYNIKSRKTGDFFTRGTLVFKKQKDFCRYLEIDEGTVPYHTEGGFSLDAIFDKFELRNKNKLAYLKSINLLIDELKIDEVSAGELIRIYDKDLDAIIRNKGMVLLGDVKVTPSDFIRKLDTNNRKATLGYVIDLFSGKDIRVFRISKTFNGFKVYNFLYESNNEPYWRCTIDEEVVYLSRTEILTKIGEYINSEFSDK